MFRSKRNEPFMSLVNGLEGRFDAAHGFLTGLAYDRMTPFHLGTGRNAHLYYLDGYYAYIVIENYQLELRPKLHTQIKRGTKDKHGYLFWEPIKGIVKEMDGFKVGWAQETDDGIVLRSTTPAEFFDRLLELIRTVHK